MTGQKQSTRLSSLDLLRGLIMVLMAVDHINLFLVKAHSGEFWGIPLPEYNNAVAFFSRYISHLCAPGFFFLMGMGMVLLSSARQKQGWSGARQSRFLAIRGLILIVLQFVLENPGFNLGIASGPVTGSPLPGAGTGVMHFGVLYGLGASMLFWSVLIRLKSIYILIISLTAILVTQLFTPSAEMVDRLYSPLVRILFIPGRTGIVQSFYPLVPWLGVCGLGIIAGKGLVRFPHKAFRYFLLTGLLFLLSFVVMRYGGFGDFHDPGTGWMGFLNVTKYPPSVAFLMVTLGINAIVLFIFHIVGRRAERALLPLKIFGRTALFFYILHIYLYAAMGYLFPEGTSFGIMYLFWLLGLVILYPLCVWYQRFKRTKPPESIWRFF